MALYQQLLLGLSYKKQVDLVTPLTAAEMWTLAATAVDLKATPVNEDNAQDLGKGVYATKTFKSHMQAGGNWAGRLTSEAAAMLACFGVGARVKVGTTATGGFKYTATIPDLTVTGLNMPTATGVVQIGDVSDKAIIGLACEEFGLSFKSGPGRDNATFTSNWVGTGQYAKPSGITLPAAYGEHSLNAGSLTTLALVGFDYIANDRFVDADFSWKNNMRNGFFPGSGAQNGYQIWGRMRRGVPTITLKTTVECASGSSEEDALLANTEGTGLITIAGDQIGAGPEKHQVKISLARLAVKASEIGNADGLATYAVEYTVLQHATNGVGYIEVICEQDNVLG